MGIQCGAVRCTQVEEKELRVYFIYCMSKWVDDDCGGSFVQSFDILDDFQVENIQLCAFESHESESSSSLLLGLPPPAGSDGGLCSLPTLLVFI